VKHPPSRVRRTTKTGTDPEATADPNPATPVSIVSTSSQATDEVSRGLQGGSADAARHALPLAAVLALEAALVATTLAGPWLSRLGEVLFKPAATSFARHSTTVSEAQGPIQDRRTNAE
jgi:hypothetical protein